MVNDSGPKGNETSPNPDPNPDVPSTVAYSWDDVLMFVFFVTCIYHSHLNILGSILCIVNKYKSEKFWSETILE